MNENKWKQFGLEPYGAVPNERQLRRMQDERTAFFHFGVNTFSNLEWGEGVEQESMFSPSELDCRQWMRVIRDAGFTAAILTAKHHDGFCLWPSKYTEHSVKRSPYKNGKGDVVREFVDACRAYGIRPGIYLSPWDRNAPYWGQKEYNTYYVNQLTELLTNYGDIYEVWWDGAGSTETEYDWGLWAYTVRTLQPQCSIFGSLGATPYVDLRWVGNEGGFAGDPCFATIDPHSLEVENTAELNSGKPDGARFIIPEADVSIRPGWFYHAEQDSQVRTPANLVQYWFESIGSNAMILLNFPPDRRGLIHEIDARNARTWNALLNQTFAVNLAGGAQVTCDSVRPGGFEAENLLIGQSEACYSAADDNTTPTIEFKLEKPVTFDCFVIEEVIELGHRVRGFAFDVFVEGAWQTICEKQCIGRKWAEHFLPVTTDRVRVRITASAAAPVLKSFGLYKLPAGLFDMDAAMQEKTDLAKGQSARVLKEGNEVTVELGGIFPFNTVVFEGSAGIWSYELHAFDGARYFKVLDGKLPARRQVLTFERIRSSYKLKLVVTGGSVPEDLQIEVYDL